MAAVDDTDESLTTWQRKALRALALDAEHGNSLCEEAERSVLRYTVTNPYEPYFPVKGLIERVLAQET